MVWVCSGTLNHSLLTTSVPLSMLGSHRPLPAAPFPTAPSWSWARRSPDYGTRDHPGRAAPAVFHGCWTDWHPHRTCSASLIFTALALHSQSLPKAYDLEWASTPSLPLSRLLHFPIFPCLFSQAAGPHILSHAHSWCQPGPGTPVRGTGMGEPLSLLLRCSRLGWGLDDPAWSLASEGFHCRPRASLATSAVLRSAGQ